MLQKKNGEKCDARINTEWKFGNCSVFLITVSRFSGFNCHFILI